MGKESREYNGPSAEDIHATRLEAAREIHDAVTTLRGEGIDVTVEQETTETITLHIVLASGEERRIGFMKMTGMGERVAERLRNLGKEGEQ